MLKEMKQQLVQDTIVNESRRQFIEKGIKNTTLRSIAKELGIAFGNIYYYFKYKIDICDVLWIEYTNGFLDHFEKTYNSPKAITKSGLEKLRYYYSDLLDYFQKNHLYVELIAFSMGEKPKGIRSSKEMKEKSRTTRKRLQSTLVKIYEEGINDGSIKADIPNVFYEAWSFNISYVAIIINLIRYHEIGEEVYDYYVDTYLNRLTKIGG
ncbi:MAG: TetR/AcrR family transcriptional regulator [Candidatus Cloacimonetes bacterium]|nr:TetR/AcrR family transcriptional regulator [Candidatus Cloacimonadota bacterium]